MPVSVVAPKYGFSLYLPLFTIEDYFEKLEPTSRVYSLNYSDAPFHLRMLYSGDKTIKFMRAYTSWRLHEFCKTDNFRMSSSDFFAVCHVIEDNRRICSIRQSARERDLLWKTHGF
jgi:hypothetical protein